MSTQLPGPIGVWQMTTIRLAINDALLETMRGAGDQENTIDCRVLIG